MVSVKIKCNLFTRFALSFLSLPLFQPRGRALILLFFPSLHAEYRILFRIERP